MSNSSPAARIRTIADRLRTATWLEWPLQVVLVIAVWFSVLAGLFQSVYAALFAYYGDDLTTEALIGGGAVTAAGALIAVVRGLQTKPPADVPWWRKLPAQLGLFLTSTARLANDLLKAAWVMSMLVGLAMWSTQGRSAGWLWIPGMYAVIWAALRLAEHRRPPVAPAQKATRQGKQKQSRKRKRRS
ncbi:MAG: hypothetical protein ACTH0V_00420 [Microbacteriaceae bacterium]